MQNVVAIPADYNRIRIVSSLREIFSTEIAPEVNAITYSRSLKGRFDTLANVLYSRFGAGRELKLSTIEECAQEFDLYKDECTQIIQDMIACTKFPEHYPHLRIIPPNDSNYQRDDTYTFHGDGPYWRVLISYNGATTIWAKNEDVVNLGRDRFRLKEGGIEHSFAHGDVWRQRGKTDGCEPFIHRAPVTWPTDSPRLLLVS